MAVYSPRATPKVKCRMCDSYFDSYSRDEEMMRHTIFGTEMFWSSEGCNFPSRSWANKLRRDERTGRVRYKHSCGCVWVRMNGGEALCIEAAPDRSIWVGGLSD